MVATVRKDAVIEARRTRTGLGSEARRKEVQLSSGRLRRRVDQLRKRM